MTELTLTEKIPIAGKLSTSHIAESIFGMFTLIQNKLVFMLNNTKNKSGVLCYDVCRG